MASRASRQAPLQVSTEAGMAMPPPRAATPAVVPPGIHGSTADGCGSAGWAAASLDCAFAAAALAPAAAAAVGTCKAACHAAAEGDLAALAKLGVAAVAAIDQQVEESFWVERAIVVGAQSCRANCDSATRG